MPDHQPSLPPKYGPGAEHNAMPRRVEAAAELIDAALDYRLCCHGGEGGSLCVVCRRLVVARKEYREAMGDD